MISLDAALALLLADVDPLDVTRVALADALDRVLAEDLIASFDQPQAATSAMDGYALASGDAVASARLALIGESYAGAPFVGRVGAGQAVRIATGAIVPAGAERVIMQEVVERAGNTVHLAGPIHDAHFVRPAAGDFARGDVLLEKGARLTPACIGLAAAANVAQVAVRRRPRVAIHSSGDEVREPGQPLRAGDVADSAGVALDALVRRWGGDSSRRAALPDEAARIEQALAADRAAHLTLFIGGASVGDRDLLRAVVIELGGTMLFDRIAVQPGKPSWHAILPDGRRLLGLPGNPASAFICAHLLVEPLMAAMLGRVSLVARQRAMLASELPPATDRETYWRATLAITADGRAEVTPDPRRDSSLQVPLAAANALIRQPAHAATAGAGSLVDVLRLD